MDSLRTSSFAEVKKNCAQFEKILRQHDVVTHKSNFTREKGAGSGHFRYSDFNFTPGFPTVLKMKLLFFRMKGRLNVNLGIFFFDVAE